MQVQPELEQQLRAFFARRGRTMPERNVKQATTIPRGTYLPNPIGTAPGWWVERNGKVIISMPGVPHEMRKMWEEQALPRLAKLLSGGAILSRTLKLVGIGESHAEEALGDLTRSTNPTLATYAKSDGIHLRLTSKAVTLDEAIGQLDAFEPKVRERVGEWVYGADNDSFPAVVGDLLRARGWRLAVAESATGGQLASLITEASGASDYFVAGYVAYSRAAKEALGVPSTRARCPRDDRPGDHPGAGQSRARASRRRGCRGHDRRRRTERIGRQSRRLTAHRGRRPGSADVLRDALFDDARRVQAARRARSALSLVARAGVSKSAEEWRATTLRKALDRAPERDALFDTTSHVPVRDAYTRRT